MYIFLNALLEHNSLKILIDQLPCPFKIMGDFNPIIKFGEVAHSAAKTRTWEIYLIKKDCVFSVTGHIHICIPAMVPIQQLI